MKPEELDALIEKYFRRYDKHSLMRLVLSPRRTTDNTRNPYARWIVQHDDGWYVQTGNHRSSVKEGTRYDTLEQAVVVAVALMTLKVEK